MSRRLKNIINYFCLLPFIGVIACVFATGPLLENGIVTGKYFAFYGAVIFVPIATLVAYVVNKHKFHFSFVDYFLLLFIACGIIVTSLNAVSISTTKPILLILLLILYLSLRILLTQNSVFPHVIMLSILVVISIEAVWGLLQIYGFAYSYHGLFKTTGSFFNPGPYAGFLCCGLPLSLYLILLDWRVTQWRFRKLLIVRYIRLSIAVFVLVCVLMVLPASMSRSSWLGAIGGSMFVLLFWGVNNKSVQKWYANHKKVILLVSVYTFLMFLISLFGLYHVKKDSADGRMLMWKISAGALKGNPWGVGIGNFGGAYGKQQAIYFASGKGSEQEKLIADSPDFAFNEYLQIAIEFGIVPLLFFILFIAFAFKKGVKQKNFGSLGGVLAILTFAFMSYPFSVLPILVVFVYMLTLSQNSYNTVHSLPLKKYKFSVDSLILLIALIFTSSYCVYNRIPTYMAYKEWKAIKYNYRSGRYPEAIKGYELNFPYLHDQAHFLFEYAQCLSKTSSYYASNNILQQAMSLSADPMFKNVMGKNYQAMGQYKQAELCFKQAASTVPNRLYPEYLLFKLYIEQDNIVMAKKIAINASNKPIKINSPAIQDMLSEMKKILE